MTSVFDKDNLYLLEFLVDRVTLEYCAQQDLKCMTGETCVSFQFLNNPAINICEEDFIPKQRNYVGGCSGCSNVKNGKSCLFSLTQDQAVEVNKKFDMIVKVMRRLRSLETMLIGVTVIHMAPMFIELMETCKEKEMTSSKTMKDCYPILQMTTKDKVGHISAYVRITCMGKSIINQFQMNIQEKSCDFKADKGFYLFKYNKYHGLSPPCGTKEDKIDTVNIDGDCPPPPCGFPTPCIATDPCGGPPPCPPKCYPPPPCPICSCRFFEQAIQSEKPHEGKKGGKKGKEKAQGKGKKKK